MKITISSIESSIHFSLEYFFRYDIFLMRTITRTKPSRSDAKRAIQRGDPKTRNGGMTKRRNGGILPQILKRGMAENHPKS